MYEQEKWELRSEVARELGLGSAETVALTPVPPLERPTRPVTRARKRRLRAHLQGLTSRGGEPAEAVADAPPQSLVGEVCKGCRGRCCRNGAEHAFLKPADFERGRAAQPEGAAADLVDEYLGFVPKRGYRGSCIFHSASGCALPWRLRSETCRRYFCDAVQELRARSPDGRAKATVVLFPASRTLRRLVIRHDAAEA